MAAVAFAVFLLYSNTFNVPFQFDDSVNIVKNPAIQDFSYFLDTSKVESMNSSYELNRPIFKTRYIGYLTFALNYALGGLDVRGYHLVNILIHIVNSMLLYWLLFLIFKSPYFLRNGNAASVSSGGRNLIIVFTVLLFASHPLQTQAITYIVQRFASLTAMFYLLTMVLYVKFRLSQGDKAAGAEIKLFRLSYYAVSLLSAVLAMKTKELAVTIPVMLTVIEFMFFEGTTRRRVLYLLPFLLATLIIPLSLSGTRLWSEMDAGLDEAAANISGAKGDISRGDYLLTQFRVIVTYLRLLLFPAGQNLDYDYPIYTSFLSPAVITSFIFLSAIVILGAVLWRLSGDRKGESGWRLRLISFGIFWFFVTIAPESSIIPINDVIFEHRVYLPSAGFFLVLTSSLELFISRWEYKFSALRKVIASLLLLIIAGLSAATYVRNMIWTDKVTLWEDVVKKSPYKARPHNILGSIYASQNRIDEAVQQFKEAIAVDPRTYEAHYSLGVAYLGLGRTEDAINEYKAALSLKMDYAEAHFNLGVCYSKLGRVEEAIKAYQMAIMIHPDSANAYNNLGNAYSKQGRMEAAVAEYRNALKYKPDFFEAHYNLGSVYARLCRKDDALNEYRISLSIRPDSADALRNIEKYSAIANGVRANENCGALQNGDGQ
jgi:tetratricopeptide (TPR) repeat protein